MENIKFKEMSNSELKICIETLTNEYDSKKNQIIKLCEDMEKIEKKYLDAKYELEIRKNLFI
jgi:hypothetical protein